MGSREAAKQYARMTKFQTNWGLSKPVKSSGVAWPNQMVSPTRGTKITVASQSGIFSRVRQKPMATPSRR
jgi:hypothetical protein